MVPALPPVHVHGCRLTLSQEGMVEHAGEFRFNVDQIGITSPDQTVVYYRDSTSKPFRQLPTRFNPSSRELVVDTASAGEFCFGTALPGLPSDILPPTLVSPIAGRSVLVGTGVRLQISPQGASSNFTYHVEGANGGPVVHNATQASDKDTTIALAAGTYVWKASAHLSAASDTVYVSSEYSALDSFVVENAFVQITEPMNSVVWTHDSAYVVTWNTNLVGLAKIELLKDDAVVALIRDSVKASSGGFLWRVPVTVPEGTGYVVRVRTLDGDMTAATGSSAAIVEIRKIITSVEEDAFVLDVMIAPNPASSQLFIGGSQELTRVQLFTTTGEMVRDVAPRGTGEQLNVSDLAVGTYMLRLSTRTGTATRMVAITR
jgi:hypothetical protein